MTENHHIEYEKSKILINVLWHETKICENFKPKNQEKNNLSRRFIKKSQKTIV